MKTIITTLFLLSFTASTVLAQQDEIPTSEGTLTLTTILHSTMTLESKGKTIFVDPYGGATKFGGLGNADLILITDIHGDHLNLETLGRGNGYVLTFADKRLYLSGDTEDI